MKLRNKKTGEIGKLHCDMNVIPTKYGVFEDTDIRGHYWEYASLAELNEDWEDYKPKEPLIKDEKIRKAVRAWAESWENGSGNSGRRAYWEEDGEEFHIARGDMYAGTAADVYRPVLDVADHRLR